MYPDHKATAETPATSDPILREAASGPLDHDGLGDRPYRVQFTTKTIRPSRLPCFAYVVSQVTYDAIVYTAIVYARNMNQTVQMIKEFWPGAEVNELVENTSTFLQEDTNVRSVMFGARIASQRLSFFDRFRYAHQSGKASK